MEQLGSSSEYTPQQNSHRSKNKTPHSHKNNLQESESKTISTQTTIPKDEATQTTVPLNAATQTIKSSTQRIRTQIQSSSSSSQLQYRTRQYPLIDSITQTPHTQPIQRTSKHRNQEYHPQELVYELHTPYLRETHKVRPNPVQNSTPTSNNLQLRHLAFSSPLKTAPSPQRRQKERQEQQHHRTRSLSRNNETEQHHYIDQQQDNHTHSSHNFPPFPTRLESLRSQREQYQLYPQYPPKKQRSYSQLTSNSETEYNADHEKVQLSSSNRPTVSPIHGHSSSSRSSNSQDLFSQEGNRQNYGDKNKPYNSKPETWKRSLMHLSPPSSVIGELSNQPAEIHQPYNSSIPF
ncbi:MAG: hypothetical protein EZS28_038996 [Streblomastix strix]|uniref:Uncharacterized protein n=1 Tax=Streblomastix strix TaxID=222440 RepID=A0A5J4U5A8_9EUKA|nr:MAG: hypothetical protein EZS28_038996 [Streblomastix strix]